MYVINPLYNVNSYCFVQSYVSKVNKGEMIPTNFIYYLTLIETFQSEYKNTSDTASDRNGIIPI